MKRFLLAIIASFITMTTFAQEGKVEMADLLRSSGKIYVVVAAISVIFIGLFIYLFLIDRRLNKVEKES